MPFATLTDEEEKELYRLQRFYGQEALRREESKAYLAGCVMLGSALETILILMVNVNSDEAEQTGNVPTKKGTPKPLLDWQFVELLRVPIRAVLMEVTVLKPGERVQWRVVDAGAGRLGRHRSRFHDFLGSRDGLLAFPAFQKAQGCKGVSSLLDGLDTQSRLRTTRRTLPSVVGKS